MSRRKKKNHDDSHIDEAWLLPYADILTLLLALFIVLFAISSVDAQKMQKLSKVFNGIFVSGVGVLDYTKPAPQDSIKSNDGMKNQVTAPKTKQNIDQLKKLQDQDKEELKELQAKVNAYIKEKKMEGKFATSLTDEGLLLTIRDNVLFKSGRADIRPKDVHTAKELSNLLVMNPPRNIMISGHTDNVPIHNANFQSNWELSVMRALNFMKIILENKQLDPKNFSIKGYGEFKPIASNSTDEGRAKNRRVEVLIMPRVKMTKQ
ncbi:flagellar motor protein MotB [Margalitia sp. FSL K6-0131]|uniref:flagellar motor protein MotB n=1 Tax=Margalitia sp. FSL K6-0131 TaxID=2954604 RepID=UPI0030FD1E13